MSNKLSIRKLYTSLGGLTLTDAQERTMELSMTGAGSADEKQDLYNELVAAVGACSERGMYNSAKW